MNQDLTYLLFFIIRAVFATPRSLNKFLYALSLLAGTFITALLEIPLSAFLPTELEVRYVVLTDMLFKFLHDANAWSPINLTPLLKCAASYHSDIISNYYLFQISKIPKCILIDCIYFIPGSAYSGCAANCQ